MKESTATSAGNCPLRHWDDLPDKQQSVASLSRLLASQVLLQGLVLLNTSFNKQEEGLLSMLVLLTSGNNEEWRCARSTEAGVGPVAGSVLLPWDGASCEEPSGAGTGSASWGTFKTSPELGACTVGNYHWLAGRWTDRFNKPLPSLSSVIPWHFVQESNILPN